MQLVNMLLGLRRHFHKNYYSTSHPAILGIAKNASEQDIKQAYFGLAKLYHPDVNRDTGARTRFAEIVE